MTTHFKATKSRIMKFLNIITYTKIITSRFMMILIILNNIAPKKYKLMIINVNIYYLKLIYILVNVV